MRMEVEGSKIYSPEVEGRRRIRGMASGRPPLPPFKAAGDWELQDEGAS
jgi:hypothetical protein